MRSRRRRRKRRRGVSFPLHSFPNGPFHRRHLLVFPTNTRVPTKHINLSPQVDFLKNVLRMVLKKVLKVVLKTVLKKGVLKNHLHFQKVEMMCRTLL